MSVSRFVEARHREAGFFAHRESVVIYNAPALMRELRPVPALTHMTRRPFKVGFIGRTDVTKGIEHFFAGIAAADILDMEVHIAGRDNEKRIPGLIARYPQLKVTYHGFMEREAFYELVDLVVVTSMWDEPFCIVAIEPWELFKPSVSFAAGGLPEVFEHLPELVVPRGDIEALGASIARLANDAAFYADVALRCHRERSRFMPRAQADAYERVLISAARRDKPIKTQQQGAT